MTSDRFSGRFLFSGVLRTTPLFPRVFVGTGGYGIVWNDEIDPACDELRENGEAVETPSCG